jgi:CRISPR-associated protein Cmr4
MYKKAYGIIETLAPLHVGATAGEESGNLNLIFRDQFTQTGIIPGSSIRGRLKADMRLSDEENGEEEASYWYGRESESRQTNTTTESIIKLEHASIVWLPVFCPGQPIVWVSCPRLLMRYQRIAGDDVKINGKSLKDEKIPELYTASKELKARESKDKKFKGKKFLFFNLGFLTIEHEQDLSCWFPLEKPMPAVVVADTDIGMIHDMALYRQSRVALDKTEKKVKNGAFFNTEALPEGTILAFPIGIKKTDKQWKPLNGDIYLGGLESIGFGHCYLTLKGV